MNIVVQRPPIWNEAVKAFPFILQRKVIFCWGNTIFNPSNIQVTRELVAHEKVHSDRQRAGGGPEKWWERYLVDAAFRLDEELPAHIAEYDDLKANASRGMRRAALRIVATKLCSPIYGGLLKVHEAKKLIARGDLDAIGG